MRSKEQPSVSSIASLHETTSKISLPKLEPEKHKNQSINQSIPPNKTTTKHKNIIINTFHLRGLNASFQISETSGFAGETENTAQINLVTFDLRITAFRPIRTL